MSISAWWSRIKFFLFSLKQFYDQKYSYRASALAFTTLLGIVPLILVIVSVATFFPEFSDIAQQGQNYIYENFVPTSALEVQQYLQSFLKQASALPMMNIVFLIITTFLLVHTITDSLNDIWGLPAPSTHRLALLMPIYWVIVLLLPLILGSSVILGTYLVSFNWYYHYQVPVASLLVALLPIPINTMVLGGMYVIVPNTRVYWRNGLVGGFTAALFFEVARISFAFYMQRFPSYSLIYGAFAVIPIFLLWLYICWMIILYGAFLTFLLQKKATN